MELEAQQGEHAKSRDERTLALYLAVAGFVGTAAFVLGSAHHRWFFYAGEVALVLLPAAVLAIRDLSRPRRRRSSAMAIGLSVLATLFGGYSLLFCTC
jgi:hypothetical protein